MKGITRQLSLVLAACLLFPAVSGCSAKKQASSNSNQNVTLTIYTQYSSDDEKQPYDYAAAQMKKIMPNVSLKLEIMAQDDNQKLKTYAATNNLPDIFNATTDVIEAFKKSDNILKLNSYEKQLGTEEKLLPSAKSLLYDKSGNSYAVPDAGQFAALLFYNKSVFQKCGVSVPQNYDQFLAAVKTFKSDKIVPLALWGKEKWPAVQLFDMLASRENTGGIKALDSGKAKATDKAYTDAAQKIVELIKAGLLPSDVFNISADDASAMFVGNKAAMFMSGAWSMSDLTSKMGDNVSYMNAAALAAADQAGKTQWNLSGGGYNSGLGVSAHSKYKDIAAKYTCQFALEFAKGRVIKRGDPNPILKESVKPETAYSAIQQQYVTDSSKFKTMTCFDWGLTNATFKAGLEDEANKLLTGSYSVSDFSKNLQSALSGS